MKFKTFLILMVSILFLNGCGHNMKMTAVASPGQNTGYKETITSQKRHFVSLAPYIKENSLDGKTLFILFVKNCGEAPINICSNNVSVVFKGNTIEGVSRKITTLSFDDLMNEAMRKRDNEIMSDYLSGRYDYYEYVIYYDKDGNKIVTMRKVRAPMYVYAEHAQANEQIKFIKKLVMQPRNIMPGETYGGLVVCDTRDMSYKTEGAFQVTVSVDGEEHKFTFNRSLYGEPSMNI
jgi:hypothetical protein